TPAGLMRIKDFEVTISGEGQTLYYILEDKAMMCPVQLIKKDSSTGMAIPAANVKFRLLDAQKRSITMTTYYPKKQVHEIFQMDENGLFILPDMLPAGECYFREIEAPKG